MEGVRKAYVFDQKWYIKGYEFGPRDGASPYKTLMSVPPAGVGGGESWPQYSMMILFVRHFLATRPISFNTHKTHKAEEL